MIRHTSEIRRSTKKAKSPLTNTEYNRKYYRDNKERLDKKNKAAYAVNRDRILSKDAEWRRANPEIVRQRQVRYKFGLSAEEYQALISAQKGLCAICGQPPRSKRFKRLAVDHCHNTGKVRGLLCGDCNKGIGLLRDDPAILEKAISYLRKDRGQ